MIKKIITFFVSLLWATEASAHVKWFSQFSFADQPRSLTQTLSPLFWGMMGLSVFVICLLVILDRKLENAQFTKNLRKKVSGYQVHSLTIMRAAAAAVLLLCFQADSLFVPELKVTNSVVVWLQFLFACLLLFPKTVIVSGFGIMGLFVYGLVQFGTFHMLDYVLFVGVGYYLAVSASQSQKIKESGLIALYSTAGFSLCWVAIEKLLYPEWSFHILEQNPQLALGLNHDFFLTAAAFVEFSLGYLMIICLLQRPLALVVTLVFISTTLIFGKTEIIGHTIIHAALIVFLIEGSGRFFKPPINLHNKLSLKIAFAAVNFVIILFLMLVPYQNIAMGKHLKFIETRNEIAVVDTSNWEQPPRININITEDMHAGWNLHIRTANFHFTPKNSGGKHVDGEGHAHLYINQKKIGRVYGNWYYLPELPLGLNEITVTLNTNDHKMYVFENEEIKSSISIKVEKPQQRMDH